MLKSICTCKRTLCVCVGLIAGLGAYQEFAVADDDGRPLIEAEATPGTYSVVGGATMSFKFPTMTGEAVEA